MSKDDHKNITQKTRNPYALPSRQRGRRVFKDRRQGRGGARNWQRRWLSVYQEEQLTLYKEDPS